MSFSSPSSQALQLGIMNNPDYFDALPAEIILRIGELQGCSSHAHTVKRQPTLLIGQTSRGEWKKRPIYLGSGCKIASLACLARTCRRHHILINPLLHRRELQEYRAFGMFWAAKHGRLSTLDNFLKYGGREFVNFTTLAGPIFSSEVCYKNDYLLLRLFPPQGDGFWDQWDQWWIRHQWRPHLYDWKFSLLALAAMGGHDKIVTRLLDCGADVNAPSNTLCACEKFASYNCHASHALTTTDNYYLDWAPVHYAVCQGHLSTTKLLLASREARHDRELVTSWPNTYSVFYTAAFTGHLPILEFLLDAGVVAADQASSEGVALHFAVLCMGLAYMSAVRRLVESGANIDDNNNSILPPQCSSSTGLLCLAGNLEAALLLLDSKADETKGKWPFKREISETDLIRAVQVKFEDLLLSRPLPLYPDYPVWKKQRSKVLFRLRELKEQIEQVDNLRMSSMEECAM